MPEREPEPGFTHADAMPDVPPASECPTLGDILAGVSGRDPRAFLAEWDALDVRYVGDNRPGGVLAPDAHPARPRLWIRTAGELPADPAVHASVLTHASDLTLLGAALVPHGTYIGAPDCWSPRSTTRCGSTAGLGFLTGRLFSVDGALIASVAQEGLLRQAGSTRSA